MYTKKRRENHEAVKIRGRDMNPDVIMATKYNAESEIEMAHQPKKQQRPIRKNDDPADRNSTVVL